jgi:purine-binding chemotaxis protein CheW
MGRMSDARKRARQKAGAPPSPPPPVPAEESPLVPGPEIESDPKPAPSAWAEAEANDEAERTALVFPADLPIESDPPSPGRFELPSSGLAEDILGLQGAAALAAEAPKIEEPEAPAPEVAPSRGHTVSFFSSPAREERKAVEQTEHLATFFLDREEYGVDVRLVQEIRRVTEITQVPRAPDFIKGVINLRGRIIPVIDLKKKLGLGEVVTGKLSRIVVVTLKGRLLGLLVDGASQVLKVPVSLVEPAPEEVVQKGGDYLRGVAKLEKRLIILVDLETVLAIELREPAAAPA